MSRIPLGAGAGQAVFPTGLGRAAIALFLSYLLIQTIGYLVLGEAPVGGYFDELMVVGFVVIALFARRVPLAAFQILGVAALILAIGAAGTLSNPALEGAPVWRLVFTSAVIDLKPFVLVAAFLTIFFGMQQRERRSLVRTACWAFVALALFNLVFCVADLFRGVSIHGYELKQRSLLPVPLGIFDHKYKAAFTALMGFISILSMKDLIRVRWIYLNLLGAMIISLAMILSVKEIFAASVVLTLHLARGQLGGRVLGVLVAGMLAVIVLSTDNPVSEAFSNRFETFSGRQGDTVRGMLYSQSPAVATDYFPLGSGWGTFGSSASRDVHYSPLYTTYGIAYVWGGSREFGAYLVDTFWPKILAEQGWLGFLVYIWLWWQCGREAIKAAVLSRRTLMQNFALYSFVGLLFVSIATPVYNYADGALVTGIAFAMLFPYGRKWARAPQGVMPRRAAVEQNPVPV